MASSAFLHSGESSDDLPPMLKSLQKLWGGFCDPYQHNMLENGHPDDDEEEDWKGGGDGYVFNLQEFQPPTKTPKAGTSNNKAAAESTPETMDSSTTDGAGASAAIEPLTPELASNMYASFVNEHEEISSSFPFESASDVDAGEHDDFGSKDSVAAAESSATEVAASNPLVEPTIATDAVEAAAANVVPVNSASLEDVFDAPPAPLSPLVGEHINTSLVEEETSSTSSHSPLAGELIETSLLDLSPPEEDNLLECIDEVQDAASDPPFSSLVDPVAAPSPIPQTPTPPEEEVPPVQEDTSATAVVVEDVNSPRRVLFSEGGSRTTAAEEETPTQDAAKLTKPKATKSSTPLLTTTNVRRALMVGAANVVVVNLALCCLRWVDPSPGPSAPAPERSSARAATNLR